MDVVFNHLIVLDKPAGLSSARAVSRVKRLLPKGTKIGHAGTLDPFATGVLLLLVGKATKRCESLMDQPKQYEACVKLGAVTATDDPESPEQPFRGTGDPPVSSTSFPSKEHGRVAHATLEEILALLPTFIGAIQQQPPTFSALKIGGRRAYDLARRGQEVKLQPRTVQVYGIKLLHYEWPLIRLRVDCGRGTYIRAIARDIGAALSVGGYLTQLRRTRIGEYSIDTSVSLETLSVEGVVAHLKSAQ